MFDPGFNIAPTTDPMGFDVGADCFAPECELRKMDAIRPSLRDPNCDGPDVVYSIAMDVGKSEHKPLLEKLHLLYGTVTYAAGRLGDEPIRSQGHIHSISPRCGWSTPEVYEIWRGEAIIYMQESAQDHPGRCFAVRAKPAEVVIVPPGWAHATISADPNQPLTFGAWCDRAYGFEYDDVRAHGGLAWFPLLDDTGRIYWEANSAYEPSELIEKCPADYAELGLQKMVSIYRQFELQPDRFLFVPHPELVSNHWNGFIP